MDRAQGAHDSRVAERIVPNYEYDYTILVQYVKDYLVVIFNPNSRREQTKK
jgi:hypothetical protein